ncbi:MAG: hypothetical protein V3S55_09970 [Nitrospiraceae bacterium]
MKQVLGVLDALVAHEDVEMCAIAEAATVWADLLKAAKLAAQNHSHVETCDMPIWLVYLENAITKAEEG